MLPLGLCSSLPGGGRFRPASSALMFFCTLADLSVRSIIMRFISYLVLPPCTLPRSLDPVALELIVLNVVLGSYTIAGYKRAINPVPGREKDLITQIDCLSTTMTRNNVDRIYNKASKHSSRHPSLGCLGVPLSEAVGG